MSGPNLSINLPDTGSSDMARQMFLAELFSGSYSSVRSTEKESDLGFSEFLAALSHDRFKTSQVTLCESCCGSTSVFAKSPGAIMWARSTSRGYWEFNVAAASGEETSRWVDAFNLLVPERTSQDTDKIPVTFWSQDPQWMTASSYRRFIETSSWDDIRGNYPSAVGSQVESLMSMSEPPGSGKIMLFHGIPGGGKTRTILSLIREWNSWCSASVVTDADRLLGDSTYLNSILQQVEFDDEKWLLLILEDGDEFIDKDERSSKGQGISRLLNVADGILGQGIKMLTLITTNVRVESLSPAMSRPGRCMANIHFPSFEAAEASLWAANKGIELPEERSYTLAELYELLSFDV